MAAALELDAEMADLSNTEDNAPYILGGKHTQLIVKMIDAAHAAGVTPILWGEPGVGKTALIDALALRPGFGGLVRVLTGSQDKSDTLGMPSRDTHEASDGSVYEITRHATPDWVVQANEAEGTFYVFLDELPQADVEVQGTFLTVLQNYVMPSGAKIKPHVKFIAAGNPTDSVSSGYELIEPLQNRLSHFTYEPPKDEWFQGMMDAWGKSVSDNEAALRRFIVGYLVGHDEFLHKRPDAGLTENAWPSRRSWDNLARMGAHLMDDKDALEFAAIGLVGAAAGMDFVTTVFRLDSKTPQEIVADPSCVDWTNSFQGFVGLSGVLSWMSNPEDVKPVADVLNYAVKNGPKDVATTWLKPYVAKVTTIGNEHKVNLKAAAVKALDLTSAGFKDYMTLAFNTSDLNGKGK